MDRIKEINLVLKQLLEELTMQPFGLDIFLESFNAQEVTWMVRMKEHLIPFTEIEINKSWESRDSLYLALKDLLLEKLQWLTWQSI